MGKHCSRFTGLVLAAAVMMSSVLASFWAVPVTADASGSYDAKITVLDFGNTGMAGDAVLLESNGHYILMDTGYTDSPDDHSQSSVIRYLKDHGINSLDLYLSHYHNDHYFLLTTIMKDPYFTVGKFYLPTNENLKKYSDPKYKDKAWYDYFTKNINAYGESWEEHSYTEIAATIEEKDIDVHYISTGDTFSVGNADFEVLYHNETRAPSGNYKQAATGFLNNESLVTMVTVGGVKYLTCGDIESPVENDIVNKKLNIKADILKASHHGDDTSSTKAFMEAVKPTYVFCTGGYTKTLTSRAADVVFNYAGMKKNGVLTYTIKDGMIEFSCEKYYSTVNCTVKLADGTTETRAFMMPKDYTPYFTAKMIPAGASYKSIQNGWYYNGTKRYFYENNAMVKGQFRTISEKKFYFNGNDGRMEVRWTYPACGGKCYCGNDGIVWTGWKTIDGKTYYFNPNNNGIACLGKFQQVGKTTVWFFSDPRTAVQVKNDWGTDLEGNKYHTNTYGEMQFGWTTISSKKYYFDPESGIMQTGWLVLGDKTYYLGEDGVMVTGEQTIDGEDYVFDSNGVLQEEILEVMEEDQEFSTDPINGVFIEAPEIEEENEEEIYEEIFEEQEEEEFTPGASRQKGITGTVVFTPEKGTEATTR